jgi:hypothetical protein
MKEIIRQDRIGITDGSVDRVPKLGWRFYFKNGRFVDVSDELIIELNGQEKGEKIIADLEKELIHQFNLS